MYALLLRELQSISWPSWEARANNSHLRTHRQSTYSFSLDKGPDCQKCCRLIKQRLIGIPSVSIFAVFCFQHRNDHVGQSQLALLNRWDWEPVQKDELGSVKYTSSLAIFTNSWRGSGVPAKLEESAARLYGDSVALKCFRSKPGRLIKTRWLSSDSIEDKIIICQDYLGPVFNDVFEAALKKHREARSKGSGGSGESEAKAETEDADLKLKQPSGSRSRHGRGFQHQAAQVSCHRLPSQFIESLVCYCEDQSHRQESAEHIRQVGSETDEASEQRSGGVLR